VGLVFRCGLCAGNRRKPEDLNKPYFLGLLSGSFATCLDRNRGHNFELSEEPFCGYSSQACENRVRESVLKVGTAEGAIRPESLRHPIPREVMAFFLLGRHITLERLEHPMGSRAPKVHTGRSCRTTLRQKDRGADRGEVSRCGRSHQLSNRSWSCLNVIAPVENPAI
jgi:hypothetical protein